MKRLEFVQIKSMPYFLNLPLTIQGNYSHYYQFTYNMIPENMPGFIDITPKI